jgi:hypothetical protein
VNSLDICYQNIAKSFLSIHPSSVIASHPEWVQGHEPNVRRGKACIVFQTTIRKQLVINIIILILSSSNFPDDQIVEEALYNQLLCYLQLLETNKPFLLNITRVPGINYPLYHLMIFISPILFFLHMLKVFTPYSCLEKLVSNL